MAKKTMLILRMSMIFLSITLVGGRLLNVLVSASSADLNQDGIVNMKDLSIVAKAYGSYPGDLNWNPRADISSDFAVDMVDVALVAIEYEKGSSRISSLGMDSADWSKEERSQIYQGTIKAPDIFVSFFWWAPDISNIHEKSPDKAILIYRNLRKVEKIRTKEWASKVDWRLAEYEFARDNNILCKDSSGNYVRSKTWNYLLADIGNPKWQQFIADWIKFYIDNFGFDGVYLDNGLSTTVTEVYWDASARPINPRSGTYYTDKEIIQYHVQVHRKIRETIGPDKLIICNGIYHGKRFFEHQGEYLEILKHNLIDGFKSEGLFGAQSFWGEDKWLKSVEFVRWLQDNWLEKGKIFVPSVNWYRPGTKTTLKQVWVGFSAGYSLEHSVTFHYASTLLGIKATVSESNYFSMDGCWYEPFAERLYSLNLGEPTTDYYRIEKTRVYARKFQRGLVIVNPTETFYNVPLQKNYKTLDGKILSSLTIGRFEGVILLNI